jgi:hypothetical protein
MTMVKDGKFQQTVRSDFDERHPAAVGHGYELQWTKFDFEMLQEACPSDARKSLEVAPMSEWTEDLDAESMAIHADLFKASLRALPDD